MTSGAHLSNAACPLQGRQAGMQAGRWAGTVTSLVKFMETNNKELIQNDNVLVAAA